MKDFANTTTIYTQSLRTITLKIRQDFLADPGAKLPTAESPNDIYEILKAIYRQLDDDQEHLVLLVLNLSQEVSGYKVLSSGNERTSLADGKIVFRNALLLGASSIVVAHNHPSGKLKPSAADINFTNKIIEAGKTLDIPVLDHIILTDRGYISLRDERRCKFQRLA
jgi:DNA repair protein RadC